jgi:hypothetical protein
MQELANLNKKMLLPLKKLLQLHLKVKNNKINV